MDLLPCPQYLCPDQHECAELRAVIKRRWPALVVTLWSVLGLFVAVALLGFTFLDMAVAGDLGLAMDSDNPHPRVDRVSYTLAGLTYLHGDQVLTGPHRSLPLTLGWLALTTLLMWGLWRQWGVPSARQALRTGLLSLTLVVAVGGPGLMLATWHHNRMLRAPTAGLEQPMSRTSAWPHSLSLSRCERWPGCEHRENRQEATWPNPAIWAVLGVLATAGAGLWRPAGRSS